jgi:tetratricopeptide (TPR) repeat protein
VRTFNQVFHNNGLALIEAHRKRPERALALVTEGMAELDARLGTEEHQLHRSVLLQNRAQVLAGLGRLTEALVDYRTVAAVDPYYPEYHFELANVLAKVGESDEALAEYDTATRLGPPFPELFYNRGDLLLDMGDETRAAADFAYVLELDPRYLPAYVNLAGIHLDRADLDAAERVASDGLAQQPDHADLLAVLGHVRLERGAVHDASVIFDAALAVDGDLVAALSGKAAIAHQNDDPDGAIQYLTHAIDVSPDEPALRYNRAVALRDVGRLADALDDLAVAAELAPDDGDVLAAQNEWQAGHVPA